MLERMEDFFARRVEEYDEHMLQEVEGCEEGYRQMATLVPGEYPQSVGLRVWNRTGIAGHLGKEAGHYGICH